jgi:hypothetical protein
VAIAFVVGSIFIGHGIRDKNRNDVISVTGSARKRIVSDYTGWNLSVTTDQRSAEAAARELAGWMTRIHSFLTNGGMSKLTASATHRRSRKTWSPASTSRSR